MGNPYDFQVLFWQKEGEYEMVVCMYVWLYVCNVYVMCMSHMHTCVGEGVSKGWAYSIYAVSTPIQS